MAAGASIALSFQFPILHLRKLGLSKGKEVAQGHPGSCAGQDSIPSLSELTPSTHTPPLPITGEKPEKNSEEELCCGWFKKAEQHWLCSWSRHPMASTFFFNSHGGVSQHLLTDSRPAFETYFSFPFEGEETVKAIEVPQVVLKLDKLLLPWPCRELCPTGLETPPSSTQPWWQQRAELGAWVPVHHLRGPVICREGSGRESSEMIPPLRHLLDCYVCKMCIHFVCLLVAPPRKWLFTKGWQVSQAGTGLYTFMAVG